MDVLRLIYQIPVIREFQSFSCANIPADDAPVLKVSIKFAVELFKRDNVRPLRRRLIIALVQSLNTTLTDEQSKKANPPTSVSVLAFCNKNALIHSTVEIPIHSGLLDIPPAILHVIDLDTNAPPTANRRTVLYLHGGGYINSPSPVGQLGMALETAKAARARYLFILEYSLAPKVLYPGQTVQAVAALQILCAKSGSDIASDVVATGGSANDLVRKFDGPAAVEDLILIGDSAGGPSCAELASSSQVSLPLCTSYQTYETYSRGCHAIAMGHDLVRRAVI
jgi:hypothetical protein